MKPTNSPRNGGSNSRSININIISCDCCCTSVSDIGTLSCTWSWNWKSKWKWNPENLYSILSSMSPFWRLSIFIYLGGTTQSFHLTQRPPLTSLTVLKRTEDYHTSNVWVCVSERGVMAIVHTILYHVVVQCWNVRIGDDSLRWGDLSSAYYYRISYILSILHLLICKILFDHP